MTMNKKKIISLAMLSLFCLGKAYGAVPTKGQEWKEHEQDRVYRLNGKTDSLTLISGFTATDTSVEFDLLPQNSAAQAGVLLRYTDKDNWIYVGCEKATDHLGFAHWYVATPDKKMALVQDISKWYAHHKRRIKVNCIGQTVTVYVDGEQIAHKHFPGLPASSGQIGFRAHDKGNVHFSNIRFRPLTPTTPRPGKSKDFYTLSSPKMEVKLNKNFPSVHSYRWKKDGSRLDGQPFDIKAVCINGNTYSPKVSGKAKDGKVVYQLDIKEIGIRFAVHCELKENVLSLSIHDIEEKGTCKVRTIAFPQHHLVTVANNAPEARLSIANGVKSDTFLSLKDKEADATHQYGTIVLLNNDKLAATLESNSIYSTRQFLYQTIQTSQQPSTSIWGNEWIYRGHDGNVVDEPYIKVILSDDANGDGKTDWQDGAIALQKEYPQPKGIDLLHNSYATITMNFASFAQYPFLRQLDNIKRFYLATDGFGQMVELKGYQSEGHDSAHPDYAGHYNERAGGKKELAYLA